MSEDKYLDLPAEQTFEVVRAFGKMMAYWIANLPDPSGALAELDIIREEVPRHLTPEQVKLFDHLLSFLKADVAKACEGIELLKNPQ